MRNQLTTLFFTFVLTLIVSISWSSNEAQANTAQFKAYGDFSYYSHVIPGPNEVYGQKSNIIRKMDVYGNIIWEHTLETDSVTNVAKILNNYYVFVTSSNNVILLNTTTGEEVFVYKDISSESIQDIYLDDNNILYASTATMMYAIDSKGVKLWGNTSTSPTVKYINDTTIIEQTGATRWIDKKSGSVNVTHTSTVFKLIDETRNIVYLSSGTTLLAIRLSDGIELWRKSFSATIQQVAKNDEGNIYVSLNYQDLKIPNFYLIDAKTRTVLFSEHFVSILEQLVIKEDNTIFLRGKKLPSSTRMLLLSKDGKQINDLGYLYADVFFRQDGSMYSIYSSHYYSTTEPTEVIIPPSKTIKSMAASEKDISTKVGETKTVNLMATYSDESTKDITTSAKWSSSDASVATVSNGQITALAPGKATITATFDNQTTLITVNVKSVDTTLPTTSLEFSQKYVFSELVSNTTDFNSVLAKYSVDELQVIVPAKHFYKITTAHVAKVLTNLNIETSRDVRKIEVQADGETYTAKRTSTTHFEASMAGLAQGTELVIIGYDGTGTKIAEQVLRLRNGETVTEEQAAAALSGQYVLRSLMLDTALFNTILSSFALEELQIGIPKRYINDPSNDIKIVYGDFSTKFSIQTTGTIGKVVIVTASGESFEAKNNGKGLYTRDITGLQFDEIVTIQVLNTNGDVVQSETAFIE